MLYNCTYLTLQELVQFQTTKGKLKKCELTLYWPEEMTFTATATNKMAAEKMAAALACLKLKVRIVVFFGGGSYFVATVYICIEPLVQEMGLLDKNNKPMTHAKYHREEVKEAAEREKQPLFIDVPTHLKEKMRRYLEEVSFHLTHFIRFLFQTGPGVLKTYGRFE